jgi:mono/diheme cytochrome c family protein
MGRAVALQRAGLARALAAGLLLGLAACAARPPGKVEQAVMTRVKRITVGGKADRNPFPPTAENVRGGKRDFSNYCVACHGLDGQNTGVPFAAAMSPPVPSLASSEVQGFTDGQLKWIVENGIFPSGMPASRGILNEDEMWRIVLYLRHLPPAGSLGEPAMYGGAGPGEEGERAAAPPR